MLSKAPPTHHYQPPTHEGLDVVYRDRDLLVVNKPAGLLSVPGRGPERQDCLALRVRETCPDARIVHRLDMETSGLMLFARTALAQRGLSRQFERREVRKEYVAVVQGRMPQVAGTVDLPLMRDWPNRPRQKVDHVQGKASLTHYRRLGECGDAPGTRLLLTPVTGRTHQLRIHLNYIGYPIVGDRLYGDGKDAERLLLHASALSFSHPAEGRLLHLESRPGF